MMDNRPLLEKLTHSFDHDDLVQFMRGASGKFRPEKKDFSHFLETATRVRNLQKLGQIDFEDGRRLILLAGQTNQELSTQSGRLKQYEIARKVLKDEHWDAGIFVFHDEAGHFRFSWITASYTGTKREFSSFRRYTYFVSPETSARTFVEQIGKADFSSVEKITEAFSVEPVTKEFFRQFREIFEEAEATIKLKWSEEKKRLYTQRFFNRVLFITFLERKGWLTFGGFDTPRNDQQSYSTTDGRVGLSDSEVRIETTGRDSTAGLDTVGRTPTYSTSGAPRKDYLRALFEDYYKNTRDKNADFHRSRLNALFFMGLNHPSGDKRQKAEYKPILSLIGDVPYLNGGLFEEEEDDRDGPTFPDGIIAKVLNELVYQFNFTVTESTPLDVEVAVDPEMLGRIFEELVTGRHESGSYYTPKPVVAFMCREALKGYLVGRNSIPPYNESAEAIALFVDKNDASLLRNPMQVVDALRAVKVCDPACGSGAYLLGMLHELLEQYAAIFSQHQKDAPTIYKTKLDIIQNNLYGVDKDDFAVNIARLRLWLSLIVDFEGGTPPPLPNLDFKIECGDSLTAPDPSGGLQPDMFRQQQVKEFLALKNAYMDVHEGSEKKKKLGKQIDELKEKIKEWAHVGRNSFRPDPGRNGIPPYGFDWQVDFAEVFAPELATPSVPAGHLPQIPKEFGGGQGGGFDIVLANPPYVRADVQFKHIEDEEERQEQIAEWQTFRKQLKDSKIYKTLHEKWDLYIPFLERAYQLLRQNGQMIFIIPDAYNAAKYAGKSHEFFLQNTVVERIDFCSEINLFNAGVNNTVLHFAKVTPTESSQPVRARRWGEKDDFELNQELLETGYQNKLGAELFKAISAKSFDKTGFVTLETICYVSKGMVVHAEEDDHKGEFGLEDLLSPKKDKEHPKPFAEGKDLVKWIVRRHKWLEYNTKRAPAYFSRPTFPELYEVSEKLISMDIASGTPRVVYDQNKIFHNHSAWSFVPWHLLSRVINNSIRKAAKYHHQDPLGDREQREEISKKFNLKYVLAIMNSSFAREWLKGKRRSKMHIYPDDWKQLPIAPIPLEEQKEFVKLVDKI